MALSSIHYGSELGLGVHDYWDGFETKQYTLIDYINMDLDAVKPPDSPTDLRKVH